MNKKYIIRGLLSLVTCLVIYVVYVFYLTPQVNLQPIYLIPKSAVIVMETDKPFESWGNVSDSETWSHLQKNDYFNEISGGIQSLNTLFRKQRKLFNILDDRNLFISIHPMPQQNDFGLLYVMDLKKLSKINPLKAYLENFLDEGCAQQKTIPQS